MPAWCAHDGCAKRSVPHLLSERAYEVCAHASMMLRRDSATNRSIYLVGAALDEEISGNITKQQNMAKEKNGGKKASSLVALRPVSYGGL